MVEGCQIGLTLVENNLLETVPKSFLLYDKYGNSSNVIWKAYLAIPYTTVSISLGEQFWLIYVTVSRTVIDYVCFFRTIIAYTFANGFLGGIFKMVNINILGNGFLFYTNTLGNSFVVFENVYY